MFILQNGEKLMLTRKYRRDTARRKILIEHLNHFFFIRVKKGMIKIDKSGTEIKQLFPSIAIEIFKEKTKTK